MKTKMKNYGLIALFALGAFALQSCDKDDDIDNPKLPETVQQDFANRYPNAGHVQWEQEKATKKYEAEFYYNGTHSEWQVELNSVEAHAWYQSNGAWEKTEFEATHYYWSNSPVIPEPVRNKIQSLIGNNRDIDLDAVDTPATDYFLLEIDKEPHDTYVKIDFNGNEI